MITIKDSLYPTITNIMGGLSEISENEKLDKGFVSLLVRRLFNFGDARRIDWFDWVLFINILLLFINDSNFA